MIDIHKCKQRLIEEALAADESNRILWERARKDARSIVEMIMRDFAPIRIYQWGSVLEPDHFNEISDIDIAVEGITKAENIFSLLAKASEMTDFSLDIVQIECIAPEFANIIRMKGVVVYER